MADFDPSKFFDLSDFDLTDGSGFVSNEQVDAEEKDAHREAAPNVNGGTEPISAMEQHRPVIELPSGFERLTPEQVQEWAASYKAANGNTGSTPPATEPAAMTDSCPPLPPGFEYMSDEELSAWLPDKGNGGAAPATRRPTIVLTPGDLPQVVDAAEAALIKADTGLYQRGSMIVRPAMVTIKISGGRETTAQCLTMVSPHALAEEFTRTAAWARPKGEDRLVPIDCPLSVAKTYLARAGQWRLPVLTGIINAPTMREDGSLLDQPGYDEATGLLLDPQGCAFLPVADKPTRKDAWQALAVLQDLLKTFPFVSDADRSVALSAILTAVVRRSLPSAPLHGFTAPVAGSGKSMLVDIASIIATGYEAAVVEEGDEEELPKRLGAALLAGSQIVTIDNCERPLGGGFLCQALTQPYLNVRILGQSENRIVVPDAFLCATGNNLKLAGDMTRRAVLCTLDPGCERPELREFDVDPIETVKANRPRFVHAALTILRAYHAAGRPQKVSAIGSFESWSKLVRAALVWLGGADLWATTEAVRGGDPKLEALTAVVEQWRNAIGAEPVSVRALIDRATKTHQPGGCLGEKEFLYPDFREALLSVAGHGGAINGQALGNWLGRNRGHIIGGFKLERRDIVNGNATWQLMNA